MTYAEQMQHDPAFRAFVEAHKGRLEVELQALRVEFEHAQSVIEDQKRRLAQYEEPIKPNTKRQRR